MTLFNMKNILNTIKKILKDKKELVDVTFKFISMIIFYGLVLNLFINSILPVGVNINNIIGYGLGYYFLKVELPPIINQCFSKPR